jgi:hypothetical protein
MPYPDLINDTTYNEIRRRVFADHGGYLIDNPVGESILDRTGPVSSSTTGNSQRLQLTAFTCKQTGTVSQIRVWTGATAAGATPTLCRMGVYQVVPGAATWSLIASIANDTSLFAAANTTYTRSFTTPFTKVAGTRYAVAILVVTAAALPNWLSPASTTVTAYCTDNWLLDPMTAGLVGSQADLPATVTVSGITVSTINFHALLLQ